MLLENTLRETIIKGLDKINLLIEAKVYSIASIAYRFVKITYPVKLAVNGLPFSLQNKHPVKYILSPNQFTLKKSKILLNDEVELIDGSSYSLEELADKLNQLINEQDNPLVVVVEQNNDIWLFNSNPLSMQGGCWTKLQSKE